MAEGPRYDLVLLLARDLASNSATPMFVVGPEGALIYYNEAAEEVLGRRFSDAGALETGQWGTMWAPTDLDGRTLEVSELPLAVAVAERRPAHRRMRIRGLDGQDHLIDVTAFPLFAQADDFVGAVAIFWADGLDEPA